MNRFSLCLKKSPLRGYLYRTTSIIQNPQSFVIRQQPIRDDHTDGPRKWVPTDERSKISRKQDFNLSKARLTAGVVLSAHVGYCVSGFPFDFLDFALLTFGTYSCSSSANYWNQFQEVPFDSQMDRTKIRHFVNRDISNLDAIKNAITWATMGTAACAAVNPTVAMLGFSNIVLYGYIYTRMKRHHWLNTQVGAIVGAIPPLMGYAAASGGTFGLEGWLASGILFFWQFPHFYALGAQRNREYSLAKYRMLTVENINGAKWCSFLSLVALTAISLYILFECKGPIHYMNYFGILGLMIYWPYMIQWMRGIATNAVFSGLFRASGLYILIITAGSFLSPPLHAAMKRKYIDDGFDYCPEKYLPDISRP